MSSLAQANAPEATNTNTNKTRSLHSMGHAHKEHADNQEQTLLSSPLFPLLLFPSLGTNVRRHCGPPHYHRPTGHHSHQTRLPTAPNAAAPAPSPGKLRQEPTNAQSSNQAAKYTTETTHDHRALPVIRGKATKQRRCHHTNHGGHRRPATKTKQHNTTQRQKPTGCHADRTSATLSINHDPRHTLCHRSSS